MGRGGRRELQWGVGAGRKREAERRGEDVARGGRGRGGRE